MSILTLTLRRPPRLRSGKGTTERQVVRTAKKSSSSGLQAGDLVGSTSVRGAIAPRPTAGAGIRSGSGTGWMSQEFL